MDKSYIKPGKDYNSMQVFEVKVDVELCNEDMDDATLELYIKDMLQGGPLPMRVLEIDAREV